MVSSPTSRPVTVPVSNPVRVAGATIESITGDSLAAHYRGDAFTEGGLGAPDIVAATNLEGTAAYNPTQGTASQQPHSGTTLGFDRFGFSRAANQKLQITVVSPDILQIADEACLVLAAKFTTATGAGLIEISTGTANSGIQILNNGAGSMVARANTVTDGSRSIAAAFSDTASIHIFMARLDSTDVMLGIDGVESSISAGGGLVNNLDAVSLGSQSTGTGFDFDGDLFEVVVMRNPTDLIVSDVVSFLASKYGVTLP